MEVKMLSMILYVLCVILADVLAARWIVPIGFGLIVPAGVFMVAPIFTLRDDIHKKYGAKTILILIFVASIISYIISVLSSNQLLGKITIASVVAFLVSEYADTIIFHITRKQMWMQRVIKSNLVSALLDSLIFIWIAFGFVLPLILGQYIVKMIISVVVGLILRKRNEH